MTLDFVPNCPPYPYTTAENSPFTKVSLIERVPHIVTDIINHLHKEILKLDQNSDADSLRIEETKFIISELSKIKHEMTTGKVIPLLEHDSVGDVEEYNNYIKTYFDSQTWLQAPFLLWETYLYRRIKGLFARSKTIASFDYFEELKIKALFQSKTAILKLSKRLVDNLNNCKAQAEAHTNADQLAILNEVAFLEVLHNSLWGNQTDLSMFPDLKAEDLVSMQQKLLSEDANKSSTIHNDSQLIYDYFLNISSNNPNSNITVGIVLDNSGFELFGDLLLATWLIEMNYANKVIFHTKPFPWYVSDVTPNDFSYVINTLANESTFRNSPNSCPAEIDALVSLGSKWQSYVDSKKWVVETDLFWTSPYPTCFLPTKNPKLWNSLCESKLLFFKGDLNYRKLISDLAWPVDTPFKKAIGSLSNPKQNAAPNTDNFPVIVALRTSKADVMVGVDLKIAQQLEDSDPNWRTSGKYGVIQANI
ncbi:Protein-glutamate O-methyltransferase [Smittium culicis]|uniref:Sugar phosphate phosphatase n=1 Tax=Smittium culicis TaxID=133412 RepID=A0A1R1X3L7_9FUNG|nr:Protein-glutamate O-methyltransferase [Smittium culicis]OMJ19049.1 Protein-glutamate O-methyltransferase [Smittium culicis]